MKLKAFSQNNPLRHLILSTVKRYFWLPLVMLLLTGVGFLGFEILKMGELSHPNGITAQLAFRFAASEVWELFPYGAFLVAVISALVMFCFLFKKKSAAAMLLTGVSRLQLFIVRYVFGLVSVLVPALISFSLLLVLGGSNTEHGFPAGVDTAILLLTLGVTILFAYTVAVLAAVVCGRKSDFFGVCAAFLFGAKGLLLFFGGMCATFLRGFPYPMREVYNANNSFFNLFDEHYTLSADGIFGKVLGDYLVTNSPIAPEGYLEHYLLPVILMGVVSLLLAALGCVLLRVRKSEFDGKSGGNPVLTLVCTVILTLSAAGLVLPFFGTLEGFFWALGVALIACVTLWALFAGSLRKLWKGLAVTGCTLAGIGLVALVLYADPFGYGTTVPVQEEVQWVRMTFKGDFTVNGDHSEQWYGDLLHSTMVDDRYLPLLESETDIRKALEVHKLLAEDGSHWVKEGEIYEDSAVYADFNVIYRMKDGREIKRCYTAVKLSTLFETLRLGDTEALREHEREFLMHNATEGTEFAISDNMLSFAEMLPLTTEEKKELVERILEDRGKKTYLQRYHPAQECLGVIWLNFYGSEYDNDYVTDPVFVYAEDKATLAWLEEKGLTAFFEKSYRIQSVEWFSRSSLISRDYMKIMPLDRYFAAPYQTGDHTIFGVPSTTVEEKEWESFLAGCRLESFTDKGERFALITLVNKDGETVHTVKYIAE